MSRKIDTVFVLALITLFAATSFLLVLIGAKQYRFVTDVMNENYESRTTSSYLAEKIRQHDTKDAITVSNLEGVPSLKLTTCEEDICYITYIYFYDGALCELVVTDNSVFTLASGQKIIEVQDFHPKFINDSLLCTEITNTRGETFTLYFTTHCSIGKEAQ
jgi:hypothetical protein